MEKVAGWRRRNLVARWESAYKRLQASMNDRIKDVTVRYVVLSITDRIVPALILAIGVSVIYKICDRLMRIPFLPDINQRVVLVTGCDSGFGKALVRRLDSLGCHVFAGCLTPEGKVATEAECSERTKTFLLDVTDQETVAKATEFVKDALPENAGLWAVLNNAGVSGPTLPVEAIDVHCFERPLSVNLLGMISINKAFLNLLRASCGRIVNTSSSMGRFAPKFNCLQSVSAHAIEAYSDCLRREMRIFDVTVHIVEPGIFHTKMADDTITNTCYAWEETSADLKALYGQHFDQKRRESVVEVSDIEPVIAAYTHALLGSFPRYRYVVGDDARLGWMLSLLPEWLSDNLADYLIN